ncbi:mCG147163 [Mus musculus]|nr:mCG147163 [Mus musculus]
MDSNFQHQPRWITNFSTILNGQQPRLALLPPLLRVKTKIKRDKRFTIRYISPNSPFPCSSESAPSPGVFPNAGDVNSRDSGNQMTHATISPAKRTQATRILLQYSFNTSREIDDQLQERRPREQKTLPFYRLRKKRLEMCTTGIGCPLSVS